MSCLFLALFMLLIAGFRGKGIVALRLGFIFLKEKLWSISQCWIRYGIMSFESGSEILLFARIKHQLSLKYNR